jgi:hypothetical protein
LSLQGDRTLDGSTLKKLLANHEFGSLRLNQIGYDWPKPKFKKFSFSLRSCPFWQIVSRESALELPHLPDCGHFLFRDHE